MKEVNKAINSVKTKQVTFQIDLFRCLQPKNQLNESRMSGINESGDRNFKLK